jgi:hypothetical protein
MVKQKQMNYLKLLYASFMVDDREVAEIYEDFGLIEYKHMMWAMMDMAKNGVEFDMDIDSLKDLKSSNTQELNQKLISQIENSLNNTNTQGLTKESIDRFKSDEEYMLDVLKGIELDKKITAFDEHKSLKKIPITQEQADAFNFFLIGEVFKEYELITIYSYLKAYSNNIDATNCFTDLISDSIYHLKRFAKFAAELGTLSFVRSVDKSKYQNVDITNFIKDNIEEEIGAEKECLILAQKIGNKELSEFLLFISRQEVYHAKLLQRALDSL